jgi:hypothetical protein
VLQNSHSLGKIEEAVQMTQTLYANFVRTDTASNIQMNNGRTAG